VKDVIGELLRASMLQQLGDDEQRAGRLRQAAQVLTGRFAEQDRELLPAALLTAADSNSSADAPMLRLAREALLDAWEMLGNAYPDEPLELYRAVLLDATVAAFTSDEDAAAAGWYTLRSAVEQLPVGRWDPVLRKVLQEWDAAIGPASEQIWRSDRPRSRRTKKTPSPAPTPIQIDSAAIKQASGLASSGNWQTSAPLIHQQLPELVEELVADADNAAMEALRRSGEQVEELVASTFEDLRVRVEAQLRAGRATELRTALLWWRTTRYSSSQRRLYQELDREQAIIAAVFDVNHLVDGLCPVSVEHVLYDIVRTFANEDITLSALAGCKLSAELVKDVEPAEGTILHAVTRDCDTPLSDRGAPLSPARAAVLLFRDLQAARLLRRGTP
jgi:hypothetical protein